MERHKGNCGCDTWRDRVLRSGHKLTAAGMDMRVLLDDLDWKTRIMVRVAASAANSITARVRLVKLRHFGGNSYVFAQYIVNAF